MKTYEKQRDELRCAIKEIDSGNAEFFDLNSYEYFHEELALIEYILDLTAINRATFMQRVGGVFVMFNYGDAAWKDTRARRMAVISSLVMSKRKPSRYQALPSPPTNKGEVK